MKKIAKRKRKIQGELTEADLAKVVGGTVVSYSRRRSPRIIVCCDFAL